MQNSPTVRHGCRMNKSVECFKIYFFDSLSFLQNHHEKIEHWLDLDGQIIYAFALFDLTIVTTCLDDNVTTGKTQIEYEINSNSKNQRI